MHKPRSYIVLIDDDEDDLKMFSSELEKKGIKVKTFDSPAEALSYLTPVPGNIELPSLIIMDYNMPKRNGQEVLLLLKDNAYTKNIPVVIYSTSMPNLLKEQLSNAGALDCFSKPWNTQELNTQVEIFQELAFSFVSNKNLV